MAFPYATMCSLRGQKSLGPLGERLPPHEVEATLRPEQVPLAVARRMSGEIAAARRAGLISDYVAMTLDKNVQLLIDYMGACERIHKTPLPFAYVVHLRRALILYTATLPLALLKPFGWGAVVAKAKADAR